MGLGLGRLRVLTSNKRLGLIEELQGLLSEAQQEIRSFSFLARPPVIQQMDLVRAVRLLAKGFGERTGLCVAVETAGEIGACSPQVRSALYRIVQEALSNIHRHSGASRATIDFHARGPVIHIVVADNGRGISPQSRLGVGLAGMRSRLSELGGRLSVKWLAQGTAIIASVRCARETGNRVSA